MWFPYSMAWVGQRLMQAMQWVQFFPQTGVQFFIWMLFRGQMTAHLPQDVQALVAWNFLAWTNIG